MWGLGCDRQMIKRDSGSPGSSIRSRASEAEAEAEEVFLFPSFIAHLNLRLPTFGCNKCTNLERIFIPISESRPNFGTFRS